MNVTDGELERTIGLLEEAIKAISDHVEKPDLCDVHGRKVYRHKIQDERLMSFLKCIRMVSALKASLVLLRSGFVIEIGALCRCIDDDFQDVVFLKVPLGQEGGLSVQQRRLINDFFKEEFDNGDPLRSSQKRDRVPRSKIHAGIARLPGNPINPSDAQNMYGTMHSTFSGYVHGAYGHIMEIYGGNGPTTLHYHTEGLLGTPRIAPWIDALTNYVYRCMLAIEVVAQRYEEHELFGNLENLRLAFEKCTGCCHTEVKK